MEKPEEFPTCDWCKRYLDRHMDAYYYGFNATGEKLIDNILCSVASAGKAFHHTDRWSEGGCTEVIQEAANAAKAEMARLKALAALAEDAMKLIDEMECAVEYDPLGGLSKQADALRKRYDALAGGKES